MTGSFSAFLPEVYAPLENTRQWPYALRQNHQSFLPDCPSAATLCRRGTKLPAGLPLIAVSAWAAVELTAISLPKYTLSTSGSYNRTGQDKAADCGKSVD